MFLTSAIDGGVFVSFTPDHNIPDERTPSPQELIE
jgi:hypothetical protein